jgi:hypothetical protein
MTEFAATVAIAAALFAVGLWSRREIAAARNSEVEFISHDLPDPLRKPLILISMFTQTTLFFMLASAALLIGLARLFEWME